MNSSGQLIIKRLKRALENARQSAMEAEKAFREHETRKQELLKKQSETLLLLARHYLPELSRASVEKVFAEAQGNLLSIVERKERRHQQIQARHSRLLETQEEVNTRKESLLTQEYEAEKELNTKEDRVAEILKANEIFQKLSLTALHAEEQLTRNEQSLKEIKKDRQKKLPDYKKSSLFQYLLKCNYGTAKYHRSGLTKRWDQWVAKLITFGELKQSYQFLSTTQKLMTKEVKRRKEEFDLLMEQIENFQELEAENQQIPELLDQIDKLAGQVEEVNQHLERLAKDLDSLDQEMTDFEKSEGDFYQEAISKFSTLLSNTEHDVLEARAERSVDLHDDRIVEDIGWVASLLDQQEEKLSVQENKKSQSTQQLKSLEFVLRRSSQTEMGTDRCTFPDDFDINELIRQNAHGVLDKNTFWEQLKSQMILEPTWASKTAEGMSDALNSSGSRMVGKAMTDLASTALQEAARRGLLRRK